MSRETSALTAPASIEAKATPAVSTVSAEEIRLQRNFDGSRQRFYKDTGIAFVGMMFIYALLLKDAIQHPGKYSPLQLISFLIIPLGIPFAIGIAITYPRVQYHQGLWQQARNRRLAAAAEPSQETEENADHSGTAKPNSP